MHISIISPIYKGEPFLEELVARIELSVKDITTDYEIILVNDSSPDNSWCKILDLCAANLRVKALVSGLNLTTTKVV